MPEMSNSLIYKFLLINTFSDQDQNFDLLIHIVFKMRKVSHQTGSLNVFNFNFYKIN